jgi:hypothetical protein
MSNFHHKFDEDDIKRRHEAVLEDINRYVRKRNPDLMDANHVPVKKSL